MTTMTMVFYASLFGVLFAAGCFLALRLSQGAESAKSRLPHARAARDLPAFHRLTADDIEVRERTAEEKKTDDGEDEEYEKRIKAMFVNHLLLGELKEGEELKTSSVRAPDSDAAKLLAGKTVEATIPANTSTTLGGRLKVGDVVDIIWFSAADAAAEPKCIDRLVVASVPAGKVPDAPAPAPPVAAAAGGKKKDGAEDAAGDKPTPPAETKPPAPPAAVISLKLHAGQVKDLIAATTGNYRWTLTHKAHLGNYNEQNDVSLCAKTQTAPNQTASSPQPPQPPTQPPTQQPAP